MTNSHVIQVSKNTLQEMSTYYAKSAKPNAPQYALFAAKHNGITITAYQSGKVLFQGSGATEEAQVWQEDSLASNSKKQKQENTTLPPNFSTLSVIGSDEVGNGSYFGPLVVCAAYARKSQIDLLKELGVRDSKELKDVQIKKIAEDLKVTIPYKLLTVLPEKYNTIQPKYNAVHMKVALHNQAIFLLLKELAPEKPDAILIDQFTPEKNYKKYVTSEKNQVTDKLYFTTKGEHYHLAVASASILCRAAFLEALDEGSKEVGFTLPSGAGKTSDLAAARLLSIGGIPLLQKYAKLHFANTQKAQAYLKNK